MRVGVIRDDLSAPILLADLEQVSRRNTSVDAPGQVRYLRYATEAIIEATLADPTTGAGATTTGSDISGSLPLTITGSSNDDLRVKTASSAAFVVCTIAAGGYSTIAALVTAINNAFVSAGVSVQAFDGGLDNIVLESTLYGVDSYLETDTIANGSNANSDLGLTDGEVRTMPAASVFQTDIGLPGAIDVSQATIEAVGATTNTNALEPHFDGGLTRGGVGIQDLVAPAFAETGVANDSFLVGMIAGYADAAFNPDSRNPAVSAGAAVAVLEDDGSTDYATANTVPTITAATLDSPSTGDVTIDGTGLGTESGGGTLNNGVIVKFTGAISVRLAQETIIQAGGSVLPTEIIVPASLIAGATTTTTSVQVQVRQLPLSGVEALA